MGLRLARSLSRRRFLRGVGVSLALPVLEVSASSRGTAPARRFVCLSNNYGVYRRAFFPSEDQPGQGYDMPPTLAPLERHRAHLTLFTNLDHGKTGGHAGVPVLLSGVRPHLAPNFPEGNLSLDQKLAEVIGARTRYPSMTLRVNEANLISFTRTGVQVPAMDLRAAWRALFQAVPAAERERQRASYQRQSSILDVVREDARGLRRALGHADQEKFDEYLEAVRGLERRIFQEEPWLDRPKPTPEGSEPDQGKGTAHDLRAMVELIALAIQTDSSRVFTLASGFAGGDFGLSGGYHGFSHHGERPDHVEALQKIEGNIMLQMAHLLDLLAAVQDPIQGGRLLDNTTVLFGCGMATGPHSNRSLPLVLAGGGFAHGEHRVYPAGEDRRVPAANLLLSILRSHGIDAERFGSSTGTLPGLDRV